MGLFASMLNVRVHAVFICVHSVTIAARVRTDMKKSDDDNDMNNDNDTPYTDLHAGSIAGYKPCAKTRSHS